MGSVLCTLCTLIEERAHRTFFCMYDWSGQRLSQVVRTILMQTCIGHMVHERLGLNSNPNKNIASSLLVQIQILQIRANTSSGNFVSSLLLRSRRFSMTNFTLAAQLNRLKFIFSDIVSALHFCGPQSGEAAFASIRRLPTL